VTVRSFAPQEVQSFGRLSGDVNPIHVDPIAARRMIFNRPVVHGVMLIAWLLDDQLRQHGGGRARLRALKALFLQPAPVGDELTLESSGQWPKLRFRILWRGTVAARGSVEYEDRSAIDDMPVSEAPAPGAPALVDSSAFASMTGEERLELGPGLEALFPDLASGLPRSQIAVLAALTRIVGMHCPGLRSILAEIDLGFEQQAAPALAWKVAEFDDRFGRLTLEVGSPLVRGTMVAFERPVAERSAKEAVLLSSIASGEFNGVKALVVGATRGLGGTLTRLLVVGGAEVVGTFNMGKDEAAALAKELGSGPGQCRFERLDIFEHDTAGLRRIADDAGGFTHLLYTATPPIFVGAKGSFSDALFEHFLEAYVRAFLRLFETVQAQGRSLSSVLFPSSVAVAEHQPGLTEYAMAKAAAEAMIASLAAKHRDIRFLAPRLPRLETDQTINRSGVTGEDPAPLALDLLRQLRG